MLWPVGIVLALLLSPPVADLEAAREAMEAEDWRLAVTILSEHLEEAPDDLEAYYLRGICYGEIGKRPNLRNRLERLLPKGLADFDAILAQDSLYKDTIFQKALLKRYDNEFPEAILLGEEQLRRRPELEHVHVGLLNFYWRFVVSSPPTEARLWLREHPGQYTDLFIARTFEQQSLFSPALAIYEEMLADDARSVPLLLALARLHFARQMHIAATRYVEQAIDALETDLDAMLLFDEIRTIISPGEQAAFERLSGVAEVRQFLKDFWTRRNPMPAAPYNARMAEHYRRLRIAETHYVFNGFRSWFRSSYTHDERFFPPTYGLAHDFDDPGVMFIRHGEPDDFSVGESPTWFFESSDDGQDSLLIFHFAPTCHNSICGVTKHFVPVQRGESFLPPRLTGLDRLEAERMTQAYITQGLSTDRHRWSPRTEQLDVPWQLASFRGLDGRTLVEAYFKVPLAELITGQDTLTFEAGFMVHDRAWREHSFRRNTMRIPVVAATEPYLGVFQIDVEPEPYRIALHVRSLDVDALRAHRMRYQPLTFEGPGVKLSDILLADTVYVYDERETTARENYYVRVNPSGTFERGAVPYVYFEVYDLSFGADDQTRYSIAYTLTGEDGEVISVAPKEQQGTRSSPIEFVGIDVSEASRGRHELTVTIEDHVAEVTMQRSRSLVLLR